MENIDSIDSKYFFEIRYKKVGIAKYMSHLDVMRAFSRAIRRAKLPIWYTQGFTNRPYVDFPFPLPLGIEGENEIVKIALTSRGHDLERYVTELNEKLPNGLQVNKLSAEITQIEAITAANYLIDTNNCVAKEELESFLQQDNIYVKKHSKSKGEIEIDLKQYITNCKFDEDTGEKPITIKVTLPLGATFNINVNLFIKALCEYLDRKPQKMCAKRTEYLQNTANIL
jgi:radical SAM-linked protein